MDLNCLSAYIRDLLAENCVLFIPLSHSVPLLPTFPLEFRGELNHGKTRVMGLHANGTIR